MKKEKIIAKIKHWLNEVVIGLNLCPFAKYPLTENRLRYTISEATTEQELLETLAIELKLLENDQTIETSLIILSDMLQDFYDYNQFLDYADTLLEQMELIGTIQIASFHPQYQFADTQPDDVENYTNRSPFPILHLLKESSVEKAIALHANCDQIPENNIRHLREIGKEKIQALLGGKK